jgi:hypothetical protein
MADFDSIKTAARKVFLDPGSETIASFVSEVLANRNRFIVDKALTEADLQFVALAQAHPREEVDPTTLSSVTIRMVSLELSGPGRIWRQLAAQLLRHFKEYEAFIDDAYDKGLLP